jgi:dienelactone hydrolase
MQASNNLPPQPGQPNTGTQPAGASTKRSVSSQEVRIPSGGAWLYGDLALPTEMHGLVLFAHGSGSGRHSARNRQVAKALQEAGLGTLLFDLLTTAEEQTDIRTSEHRFNIGLLTQRMQDATSWVLKQPGLAMMPIGYFGASTGSAAALIAAARLGERVSAVVSRGGRPDLAGPVALASVTAPTLLIVGGADHSVIGLNEQASRYLTCDKSLSIIPGATHLFEEPGALEEVSTQAAQWFVHHLPGQALLGISKAQAAKAAQASQPSAIQPSGKSAPSAASAERAAASAGSKRPSAGSPKEKKEAGKGKGAGKSGPSAGGVTSAAKTTRRPK